MSTKKLILILIAATFLAYFSSFSNPFMWDDEQFITHNVYVQNFDIGKIFTTNTVAGAGVVSNYYRPLTTLSFAIDAKIWSFGSAQDKVLNAFGFHLTNFLLHLGAGLVLFGLLLELFSLLEAKGGAALYPPFFISLFFLVHPIQTEAVTYINSRGDSLYAFFLFASLWLFTSSLRGVPLSRTTKQSLRLPRSFSVARNDVLRSIGIVVLFILSLLSKEIALAGVGLYGAILFLCHSKKEILRLTSFAQHDNIKKGIAVIGLISLTIFVYLLLRFTVLRFANIVNFYEGDNVYTRSLAIRFFTFCKVIWIYIGLLVWPNPLHMERSVELVRGIFSPWVLSAIAVMGGIGIIGMRELKRKNPWILFGLLWFLIMLIPSSGIIPINGILYEHWLYVPMVGIGLSAYGILQFLIFNFKFLIKSQNTTYKILNTARKILTSFVIVISILYMLLTIHQNNIWADPITFYTYTLSYAPKSARLHNNLAMTYANGGDIAHAIPEYKKALQLGPNYPQIHFNLGNAYVAKGQYDLAKKEYEEALRLAPHFELARRNLEILGKQN